MLTITVNGKLHQTAFFSEASALQVARKMATLRRKKGQAFVIQVLEADGTVLEELS